MYNRYLPQDTTYTPISSEPPPSQQPPLTPEKPKKLGFSSLLSGLKLEGLDTGDILLILILIFLFLEGDDMELVITLGLLLLLGLD